MIYSYPALPAKSESVVTHSVGQRKNESATFITIAFSCFSLDRLFTLSSPLMVKHNNRIMIPL